MRGVRLFAIVALLFPWALFGCTGSAPEILYPDAALFLTRDPATGVVSERLRLFAAVRDPDGADDPARAFLVHDDSELYWEFTREEWIATTHAGDEWYGMPDIRMPDGAPLPRGRYRLILEDGALSRTERELFLTQSSPQDTDFPQLLLDGPEITISARTAVVLRVYTRGGDMVINSAVESGPLSDALARQIPDESGVVAYLVTLGDGVRLESGPYELRR
jgi:hypothetical protein